MIGTPLQVEVAMAVMIVVEHYSSDCQSNTGMHMRDQPR